MGIIATKKGASPELSVKNATEASTIKCRYRKNTFNQNSSLHHDENTESISNSSTESKIQITQTRENLLLTKFKNSTQKLDNFENLRML